TVRGDAGEIASLVNREAAHAATSIRKASTSACEECGAPLSRSFLGPSPKVCYLCHRVLCAKLVKLLQYHHNPLGGLPSERLRMMRLHSEGYRAITEFDSSMRNYEGLARLVSQLGSTPPEIAMEVAPLEEAVNQRLRALVELQRQAAAVKSTHTADNTVQAGLLRWLRNTITEGKFQIAVARKNGNGAREAAEALLKLLIQSADLEESVSAVLIGPEGCGKSAALAAAVEELREQKPDLKVIVVHAKGSLSSSNDTAVLRDLHLKLVHEIQGREASLGLSSTAPNRQGWTFADYMAKVESLLKESTGELNCMVVVAVDRFHAFCHTAAKQTLLYNLFDVMQRPGVRLACVGMTNRDDVTFMLEKRIKSRFQLRV
ncbi:origin recognition complex subunit 4, partial [Perkinsus olseni]